MIYLLAKYTLLFLLATVLGFVLGYWWSRRNIVDVTEAYEDLRKATERTDAENWKQLWNRLNAIPEPEKTDLSPVLERIDDMRGAIAGIPVPAPVDFAPVESRFESLAGQIASIPAPEKPKAPDLRPLADRIEKLQREIHAIPAPPDIGPLNERLQALDTAVRSIPPPRQEFDLQPVRNELAAIREQISRAPKVEVHEPVDVAPLVRQIDALERRVSGIPQPEKIDLKPIDSRLQAIEKEIGRLGKRIARPVQLTRKAKRTSAPPKQRPEAPKILSAALYGKKDDLKLISGVGPKLERLLNENGVYYFWQVASWSRTDIEAIDQRLDVFKGRISRDDWVLQAKELQRSPDAGRMPAE